MPGIDLLFQFFHLTIQLSQVGAQAFYQFSEHTRQVVLGILNNPR